MISKEKLQEVVDEHLAEAIANQVFNRLREQWNTVIFELASTRKTIEYFTMELRRIDANSEAAKTALDSTLEEARTELQTMRLNNRKASEILKAAAKELDIGE